MKNFPVDVCIPTLKQALIRHPCAVLHAEPGAGKTTRVPLALLEESWLDQQKILLLEPRRLAAVSAATFMAEQLGESVGQRVGYRTRLDTQVSKQTRIEVITEGVLTRILQNDAELTGVGLVIFDEFHERNLHGDLGLALCLDVQSALRDDLRLLLMSATINHDVLSQTLPDAPVVYAEGRQYPVETRYLNQPLLKFDVAMVVAGVRQALAETEGDMLVFLPGAGEIRRVADALDALPGLCVLPLYGDMPLEAQRQVFSPLTNGQRKVVLATAIAETSITINGIRVVFDSGFSRLSRFDPASGMARLVTVPVSKASANQRQGRAGRTAAGCCYRLWSAEQHQRLTPHHPPEIEATDLSALVLELAVWGVHDLAQLQWMTQPPQAAVSQAMEVLMQLGALDNEGRVTRHGQRMASKGTHPRLAHMLLRAEQLHLLPEAAVLAAMLGERDVFKGADRPVDLEPRVAVVFGDDQKTGQGVDRVALARIRRTAKQWCSGWNAAQPALGEIGRLLTLAYPDRIAMARTQGRGQFQLSNGRGAVMPEHDGLAHQPLVAVAELSGDAQQARVFLAAALSKHQLFDEYSSRYQQIRVTGWNDNGQVIISRQQVRYGALLLEDKPADGIDPDAVLAVMLEGVRKRGLNALPWDMSSRQLRARMTFANSYEPGLPDVRDDVLFNTLEQWLGPYVNGMTRWDQVQKLNLTEVLRSMMDWSQQQRLDLIAPVAIAVPSGTMAKLDYEPEIPVLAVRLQELFGLMNTPCVAEGKVPVMVHLLSPARRPLQITRDLSSFWRGAYAEVKKDMKGRYPKHDWPDDPSVAVASATVRRKH